MEPPALTRRRGSGGFAVVVVGSCRPTSAIPGLVFVGKDVGGALRVYDAATAAKLASVPVAFTLASAPAIVDGLVILGGGAGQRAGDPTDVAKQAPGFPVNVTALCVARTRGCGSM